MASIDYYEDSSQHGNYQYITLEEIINNFMMSRDSDDYTSHTPRYQVLYQARRAFKEMYYDVVREIQGIELDLSPQLQVVLPPDYVSYVRISWVDDKGLLHEMARDEKLSIAKEYLQDYDYNLLFDNDGCVLIGEGANDALNDVQTVDSSGNYCYTYSFCQDSYQPNRNMSNHYKNGRYNIDKNRGIIQFGSDAAGRSVVLEYISDGLFTGCEGRPEAELRVNKFAETAILDYIYWQLVKNRRSVPANEKQRARKEYFNSRRIAKLRMNALKVSEIIQAFKGSSKWIK